MITNNFSFFGALGNAQNIAASKFLSVPNTIDVPPKYSIDTDVPSVAEFLTCSFDGRLWLFRRSRRFYLAVLKWDEDTQRLIFVTSVILSNENLIMRGIDWILTDKSFILSSDDEPFFSRIEYNADDASYFNAILRSYSFFPELETWQQIVNEQVIHIEGSTSDLWKVIPQNKLTPIEFHYYSDDNILAVTDFSPKLCYCNEALYAKGKAHIGRVYLFPCSLNENGDVTDFYLYISPDYLRSYDTENQTFNDNDGWDNLILAPLNENSACFFTPDNQDYGFCKKALNAQVTSLPQLEALDFSKNNGIIFFDGLTQSNLLLNDSGTSLLHDNLNYKCKGLRQWIDPTGRVKAVASHWVIASVDNFSLATHLNSGFFREKLTTHDLPITATSYSGKRFAMNDDIQNNNKSINVNILFDENKVTPHMNWNNIYKQLEIKFRLLDMEEISALDMAERSEFSVLRDEQKRICTPFPIWYQHEWVILANPFLAIYHIVYFNPDTYKIEIMYLPFYTNNEIDRPSNISFEDEHLILSNNQIIFKRYLYSGDRYYYSGYDIPERVFDCRIAEHGLLLNNIFYSYSSNNSPYAIFHEANSGVFFNYIIPSYSDSVGKEYHYIGGYGNVPIYQTTTLDHSESFNFNFSDNIETLILDIKDTKNSANSNKIQNFHIFLRYKRGLVFQSEISTDTINFLYSEIERSKLF